MGRAFDTAVMKVVIGDVFDVIRGAPPASYAAVMLDIDNGPSAMVQAANARLYDARGIRLLATMLAPGGRLVVWSAGDDSAFVRRLACAGLRVQTVPVKIHAGARQAAGRLFVGDKAGA